MNELCVRCNKPTLYDINTPVIDRSYFVEGSGQLCEDCWREVYNIDKLGQSDTECEPHS